ncbi:MAG TPA: universal stress protein [Puia sp.]|nr:universal stress protein [Puia sp.]
MKRILVPTDFSDCAANALDFAVQSAKILPAEIILLHAFYLHGSLYTDYMGVNREFRQSQLNEMKNKLTVLKEDIQAREGIVVNAIVLVGSLKEAILAAAADTSFDLIVMGTSGAGGLKEKIWGSNTSGVIEVTPCPLLVVPHAYAWTKPGRFLIATERFELAPPILDKIFELAGLYMAQVEAAVFTADKEEAAVFLEHAHKTPYYEEQLQRRYGERELSMTQLYGNNLETSLQAHIDKKHIDVLVMITYKKGFWERLFHPSQTQKMSYHSHIPILVIPANV